MTHLLAQRANDALNSGELFHSPVLWMHLRLIAKSSFGKALPDRLVRAAKDPDIGRRIAFSAMNIQTDGEYGLEMRMDRAPLTTIYDLESLVPLMEAELDDPELDDLTRRNLENFVRSGRTLLEGGMPDRF